MARRMMVAIAVASLVLLATAPAMAQDETVPPDEELKLERGGSLWVNGWEFVGGDGDGVAEPGERLQLFIDLAHGGAEAVRDIAGTLRSLADDVRVIEGSGRWDDLASGESGRNRVAFEIKVTEDAAIQDVDCGPMMIDPLPVEEQPAEEPPSDGGDDPGSGSDDPVSSDGGTVSSDGTVTKDTDGGDPDTGSGGGEPGSTGQTEPGASGDGTEPSDADMLEAEARAAEEDRRTAEETTVEQTTVEDQPIDEDGREPAPEQEPGVHLSLVLDVTSSEGDQELHVDNGIVCAFMDVGAPSDGTGTDDLARQGGLAESESVASTSRAPAIGSAAALLGAMALTLAAVARRRHLGLP